MDDEYVERVLRIVEQVPAGRVTTYGLIAEAVGRGGPRQVGAVMAAYGGPVPWWRVVRADGSLPDSHGPEARQAYLEEGTPLRASGAVDVRAAVWWPEDEARDEARDDDVDPQVGTFVGGRTGGQPGLPVDEDGHSVDDTPKRQNRQE